MYSKLMWFHQHARTSNSGDEVRFVLGIILRDKTFECYTVVCVEAKAESVCDNVSVSVLREAMVWQARLVLGCK